MSIAAEQRRLAAIMFTDMVGYTALSQRNEALALELLEEHRRILRSIFPRFNGTEIKTIGDAFLVEFKSALEAAQCSLEIQRTFAKRNHDVSSDHRIELRIGIHVGDVVHREGDVYGDGVNVASRIQPVAGVGGICISVDVERQIHHALDARFEKLAPIELKNVEVPMDLFRIVLPWERGTALTAQPQKSAPRATKRRIPWHEVVLAVLVVVGLIGAGIFFLRHRAPQQASNPATSQPASSPAAAILEKSIAVLPFENLSEDKANAYFTDGVQDEILTELAKIADLKVISRTSVMQYKSGVARDLREIGKQLGVAHLLEGSVQRVGGKVRVNAQLIDARTDGHLWAENYDRPLDDVFAIQSEIAKTIANQLQAKISPTEKAAIEKPPTTDLTAYDLYLRAQGLFADTTDVVHAKEKLPQAARLLDEALARDPHFLLAWCLLARVHGIFYWQGHDHTQARLDLANSAVQTALRLQPDAGEAHLALADYYYHGFRDYERARSELAIARRTLPNNAEVFEYTGYIDRREGHWEEATRNLERALELDPRNFLTLQQMALTYQSQNRYADQAQTLDRALTIVPGDPSTRISRAGVAFDWRADIKPFQVILATLIAEDPSVAPDVDDPDHALCERNAAATARALTNFPREGIVQNGVNYPHAYFEGLVAYCQGDSAKAQAAFTASRSEVEKIVEKQPDFAPALSLLGMIDAGLGRKEEARREGRRACELLPISKDAYDGVNLAANLAQIYAWTGEKDLAIEQIEAVERVPNFLSYGLLKLHPQWDSLRGDPRFEKIVASLAPKQ